VEGEIGSGAGAAKLVVFAAQGKCQMRRAEEGRGRPRLHLSLSLSGISRSIRLAVQERRPPLVRSHVLRFSSENRDRSA
jgi:hypothetical protein